MQIQSVLVVACIIIACLPVSARADAEDTQDHDRASQPAIPGDEVVTSSGKKVKVWSTKGPVAVSPAPAPFEDREKSVLPEGGVVLDVDRLPRDHNGPRPVPHDGPVSESNHAR